MRPTPFILKCLLQLFTNSRGVWQSIQQLFTESNAFLMCNFGIKLSCPIFKANAGGATKAELLDICCCCCCDFAAFAILLLLLLLLQFFVVTKLFCCFCNFVVAKLFVVEIFCCCKFCCCWIMALLQFCYFCNFCYCCYNSIVVAVAGGFYL